MSDPDQSVKVVEHPAQSSSPPSAHQPRTVMCFDDVEHTQANQKYKGAFCYDPSAQTGGARLFKMHAKYLKRAT